jgi:uncharacterized membrane protein (UPF0127 family)
MKRKKSILTKPFGHVNIGSKHYVVEVAMDDQSRNKGLSKRHNLDEGLGMLFDMPKEDVHSFQMKETYIPLDMVFIGKYGQIVDYIPNVQPLTAGPYSPKEKCKFVLEVRGNDLKDEIKEKALAKMRFFDTMEKAQAYRDKRMLQEQLIHYLNEAVNGEGIRRKQDSSRKSSKRSGKAL